MVITFGDFSDPRVVRMLDQHVANARAQTAPGSDHALDLAGLQSADITFWTAWDAETLLGMAALKRLGGGHGEVKSMYTAPDVRRRGIASALLTHVIAFAAQQGLSRLSLETGSWSYFAPAQALYRRHGFVECAPFGDYGEDPNSVFMTLPLSGAEPANR